MVPSRKMTRRGSRERLLQYEWRGDRAAEGARLEIVCPGNRTVGSNPTLSARRLSEPAQNPRATWGFPNPARPGREQR